MAVRRPGWDPGQGRACFASQSPGAFDTWDAMGQLRWSTTSSRPGWPLLPVGRFLHA